MSEQELAPKPATKIQQRTAPVPGTGSAGGATAVLQLQRSVGNAATARLLEGGGGGGVIQRRPAPAPPPPRTAPSPTVKSTGTEVAHDEYGTTTTTTSTATRGKKGGGESSSSSFDGTTEKTSSASTDTLVGLETSVKRISRATDLEITEAIETMARAGVFGETSRKAAITRGSLSATAEGSAKGSAGAEAHAKGSVTVSKDLFHALAAVFEAGASVGVEGTLEGKLAVALGPLAADLSGKLHGMAGALVSVNGSLSAGITHLYAEFAARAFAGAEGSAEGAVTVTIGNVAATGAIEGKAMAGAEAAAGGKFKIDLTGVEMSGKAEAFAGVKASAKGEVGLKVNGKDIFKISGTVGVSAGAGGKAEGEFSFRGGKLVIKGDLALALGIGGEIGVGVEVDFYALAMLIEEKIVEYFFKQKEAINRNSPSVERIPILDQAKAAQVHQLGYVTYLKDFNAYNAKKAKQGQSGIKRERIQEILDKRWHANKDNWKFAEFDAGIMDAAKDAFGAKLKYINIQSGQIRAFDVERTDAEKAHQAEQRKKAGLKF